MFVKRLLGNLTSFQSPSAGKLGANLPIFCRKIVMVSKLSKRAIKENPKNNPREPPTSETKDSSG